MFTFLFFYSIGVSAWLNSFLTLSFITLKWDHNTYFMGLFYVLDVIKQENVQSQCLKDGNYLLLFIFFLDFMLGVEHLIYLQCKCSESGF